MTEGLNDIKTLIRQGQTEQAIRSLTDFIRNHPSDRLDEVFYLLGNAYRKTGNWQQALIHYQEAVERNPNSPAASARAMLLDILNFYNKDMYNQ